MKAESYAEMCKFLNVKNNLFIGFYRVNYDAVTWENIAATLMNNASHIHVLNRAQVYTKNIAIN